MSDMLVFDEKNEENDYLTDKAKDVNAHVSETRLDVSQCVDRDQALDSVMDEDGGAKDMAITAIPEDGSTAIPESIRAKSRNTNICDTVILPPFNHNPYINHFSNAFCATSRICV